MLMTSKFIHQQNIQYNYNCLNEKKQLVDKQLSPQPTQLYRLNRNDYSTSIT